MADLDDLIVTQRHGDVTTLTLNRPRSRNAINVALAEAIVEAMRAPDDAAVNVGTDRLDDLPQFSAAVADSHVPVIAAVNGPAVTAGFELALACDFIIASERAVFADTHLRVGVYPGPVLVDLPRRVGMAWARQMSLTGDFVDAATALRLGIANEVVAHGELMGRATALAQAIAEQDRAMVSVMRADWDATSALPLAEAHDAHREHYRQAQVGNATSEGIASRRDAVLTRSRAQRS
jgi:enoyl-CoA hydratase